MNALVGFQGKVQEEELDSCHAAEFQRNKIEGRLVAAPVCIVC